METNLNCVNH